MAIRQRGTKWQVDVQVKGRRRSVSAATREEAEAKEAELRAHLYAGETSTPSHRVWTVGEAFDRTYQVAWAGARSERTMRLLGQRICAHFGRGTRLSAVTTDALDDWVVALKARGNSNGTINRNLAGMSKMMSVALDRGRLDKKPKMPRLREAQGRIRYLTDDEEATVLHLFRQWGKADHADAFVVLIDTGLRCGELWKLEGRDLDLSHGVVSVWQTKADLPRSVPMTRRVRAILERRRAAPPFLAGDVAGGWAPGSDRLFPFDNFWFRNGWLRVREHMGLAGDPQFVPHVLRHTCASRLVQRGVTIPVVKEWLGHKTITVTMRYAHLAPANLLAAVSVLEQEEAAE